MFNAHSAMLDITHCVKIFQSGLPRQNGSGDVWNAEGSKSKSQTFINLFKNLKLFCKLLYIIK
jgi:hypothetical protein